MGEEGVGRSGMGGKEGIREKSASLGKEIVFHSYKIRHSSSDWAVCGKLGILIGRSVSTVIEIVMNIKGWLNV